MRAHVPRSGHWYVVVDYGGLTGRQVRKLPNSAADSSRLSPRGSRCGSRTRSFDRGRGFAHMGDVEDHLGVRVKPRVEAADAGRTTALTAA